MIVVTESLVLDAKRLDMCPKYVYWPDVDVEMDASLNFSQSHFIFDTHRGCLQRQTVPCCEPYDPSAVIS